MSSLNKQQVQEIEGVLYQSVVGSLMYAMLGTRPDIAYSVGAISQYNSNPGLAHWKVVKWILRCLQGMKHHYLVYRKDGGTIQGFSDVDWVENLDDCNNLAVSHP